MYSCYIRCMGRETMEMNGQDSAKCQKSKLREKMVILEFVLNELNEKIVNSAHLLPLNQEQNVKEGGGSYSELQITFLEREYPPSL